MIRCLRRSQVKFPLKGARPPTGRVSEPDRLPKALLEAVRFRPPPAYAPPACERARFKRVDGAKALAALPPRWSWRAGALLGSES